MGQQPRPTRPGFTPPALKAARPAQSGAFTGVQPTPITPTKINPRKVTPKKVVDPTIRKGMPDQADVHVLGTGKLKKVAWPRYMQAVRRT